MGVPKNFRDAKCCLICTHSEVTDSRFGLFLHCTKFDTACEDTTICDEFTYEDEVKE
jgi:hypothetical protein